MAALNVATMASYIVPHSDTVETGLRSIEKLHEDLVHPFESAGTVQGGYILSASGAAGGNMYRSDLAPQLTREQFLAMLAESEASV